MNENNANFTPDAPNFKTLVRMSFQGLTNFPYIEEDFDALTNYGLLSKVVEYLNEVISNNNEQNTLMTGLYDAYVSLQDYVNDYFDNLDVQDEINNKLDEMAQDGSLTNLIKAYVDPYINAQNQAIEGIHNEVRSLASGSPKGVYATVDALESANPDTGVYVVSTDGHVYSWTKNGTNAVDLGLYQATKIGNNNVHLNNLDSILQTIYGFDYSNFTNISNTLTYTLDHYYRYSDGVSVASSGINCVEINVNAGDIFYINNYSINNARPFNILNGTTVIQYADSGQYNDFLIIPEGGTKLQINHLVSRHLPVIQKYTNVALSYNARNNIVESIPNTIYNKGYTFNNSGRYFKIIKFTIPNTVFTVATNDVLTIDIDILSKGDVKGSVISYDTTGTPTYGIVTSSTKNIGEKNYYHTKTVYIATNPLTNYTILLSPYFNSSSPNVDAYMYNIVINNLTQKTSLTNLYEYLIDGAEIKEVSPLLYLNSGDISDYVSGYVPTLKDRDIYCAGDSLTYGYNGATNSYVDYLVNYYTDSNVYKYGTNGAYPKRIVNQLTDMARDNDYPINNPSYTNASAVIINIGTNGGVTGSLNTSIPQLANATDLSDEPLTNLTINQVLSDGIKYNGNVIDSDDEYWALFSNDWYGDIGLCIEYINWKNPNTQIFLLPPCIDRALPSSTNSPEHIYNAMKEIGAFYGIEVIDINNSLGINRRNYNLYTIDGVHGNNKRNEMVGKFVAKYIENKIYQ